MISPGSTADLFEPRQVSSSISTNDVLQLVEEHGFFYQADANIRSLVHKLYIERRTRNEDATSDHFEPVVRLNAVSLLDAIICCYWRKCIGPILDHYLIALPRFRFP